MKITVKQLKQLIREQVEEMGVEEGLTKAERAAREAEMQRMRDVGTKMRTDWEDKTTAYASGKLAIYKFSAAYGGYMEASTTLGFGLGKDEKEAKKDAMKRFPEEAKEIRKVSGRRISKEEFEAENKKIDERLEQLRHVQAYAKKLGDLSSELHGLEINKKNRKTYYDKDDAGYWEDPVLDR